MLYADDSQLYVEFNKSSMASSLQHLELCIDGIKSWMLQNILKLNEDKTEVIVFRSRKYLEGMPSISIRVGDCTITPTRSVRNLGAHFDSRMNMEEFIIKKMQLQLHKIARICKYLSNDTCFCIIQGLVTSKLDYANCLLYGVNKVFLHRLQIVQNLAAHVILKMRKYDHISRARQELHWLPIQQRIAFSILTDVYKVLHGLAPTYIILLAQPARLTRSSKNFNIAFPVKVPRNSYGKRAFVHVVPTLWNNLPVSIRSSNSLLDFRR